MLCCGVKDGTHWGSVPWAVTLLLTALVAGVTALVLSFAPMGASGLNLAMVPFPALITFGVLRARLPKQLNPAWVLIGFPLLIGIAVTTGMVLREAFPSHGGGRNSGGSIVVWFVPLMAAGMIPRKKNRACNARAGLYIGILLGLLGLIPVGIAAWYVWDAVQAGKGPLFAALPGILEWAGVWTGLMMSPGLAMVCTMNLRRVPGEVASAAIAR
ncbi:MAG: hypothetical protein U0570_16200 [Phycisphaerales bacterium]